MQNLFILLLVLLFAGCSGKRELKADRSSKEVSEKVTLEKVDTVKPQASDTKEVPEVKEEVQAAVFTSNVFYHNNYSNLTFADQYTAIKLKFKNEYNIQPHTVSNNKGLKIFEELGCLYFSGAKYNEKNSTDEWNTETISVKDGKTSGGIEYTLETQSVRLPKSADAKNCTRFIFYVYNFDVNQCAKLKFISYSENYQNDLTEFLEIVDSIEFPVEHKGIMNDSQVRIRSKAGLKSEILGVLNKGDKVTVIGRSEKKEVIDGKEAYWYKIKLADNTFGWIFGAYVDLILI